MRITSKHLQALTLILTAILLIGTAKYNWNLFLFGFTTLSVTKVDFLSYDPILNGEVWAINLVPGGMGQYLAGATVDIPAEEIKDEDENLKANTDVTFTIESMDQKCIYPIVTDYTMTPIILIDYVKYPNAYLSLDWEQATQNIIQDCLKYGVVIKAGKLSGSFDGICLYYVKVGNRGKLPERPNVYQGVNVTLEVAGKGTETATIDNFQQSLARLGDHAYVKFVGSLDLYDECPQAIQNSVLAFQSKIANLGGQSLTINKWYLINYNRYTDYLVNAVPKLNDETYLNNLFTQGESAFADFRDWFNSWVNRIFTPDIFPYNFYSERGKGAYIDQSSPSAIIDLDDAVQIPELVLYIDADWLGKVYIVQPTPEPQIVSVSYPSEITSGRTSTIDVIVKNVGEGGTISTYVWCGNSIQVLTGEQTKWIGSQDTTTFSFSIIAGAVSQETTVTCEATAYALSKTSTQQFTIRIKPETICSPGQKIISSDRCQILACNSYGSGYDVLIQDCCAIGKIADWVNGEPQCVDKTSVSPPSPGPICGNGVCEPGENSQNCPQDCGTLELPEGWEFFALIGAMGLFGAVIYLKKKRKNEHL